MKIAKYLCKPNSREIRAELNQAPIQELPFSGSSDREDPLFYDKFKDFVALIMSDITKTHLVYSKYQKVVMEMERDTLAEFFNYSHRNGQIMVFTDGSVRNRLTVYPRAGGGVYHKIGSPWNKAFAISGVQNNYNAELQAIEYAIKTCPCNLNLIIYTDSESSIKAINNAFKYTESQWKAASNRRVLKSIIQVLLYRNNRNVTTQLKYVKAHNNNTFNDAADELAKLGCLSDNITNNREANIQESVTLIHNNEIIDTNINRSVMDIAYDSTKRKAYGLKKRGRWFRDNINLKLSNLTFMSKSVRSSKLKNFLTKARQELLAGRKLLFRRYENSKDQDKKTEKLKAKYNSPICALCEKEEESTEHILGYCINNWEDRQEATNKIRTLIQEKTHFDAELFPLWFFNDDKCDLIYSQHQTPVLYKIQHFDKLVGALGFIPATLIRALQEFAIEKQSAHEIATKAHKIIVKASYRTYRTRCKKHQQIYELQERPKAQERKRKKKERKTQRQAAQADKNSKKRKQSEILPVLGPDGVYDLTKIPSDVPAWKNKGKSSETVNSSPPTPQRNQNEPKRKKQNIANTYTITRNSTARETSNNHTMITRNKRKIDQQTSELHKRHKGDHIT